MNERPDVKSIIKNNTIFVGEINQLLHNEGIEINNRLDIILQYINNGLYETEIEVGLSDKTHHRILELSNSVSIDRNEIYQILFMFYCNKKTKLNLDQYYTPYTICKFLTALMIPGKSAIDPACGTGDLLKSYDGEVSLWDVSSDVLGICSQNYELNAKSCNIRCINSIHKDTIENDTYDYCCLNPPFGSSTVITDTDVLDRYILGKGERKVEIGILFIERALRLVKVGGIVSIILPNGYLGNSNRMVLKLKKYLLSMRIIAIIELPDNAFSRSGTGVSTSILIVQRVKIDTPYNIYIKRLNNIGYILNKKNTPYKYKKSAGKYLIENGLPVLDDDFCDTLEELNSFVFIEDVKGLNSSIPKRTVKYEVINTTRLDRTILDVKRYLRTYLDIVKNHTDTTSVRISDLIQDCSGKFTLEEDKNYVYLDIKSITSPLYDNSKELYGYELPGRAKISLQLHDIIVSRLKGKISFTIILDDVDNIVCSNGFCLLRPKDYTSALIIFANLFSKEFKIVRNSLCTGSIMETISNDDLKNIYINKAIDIDKYKAVIDALKVINEL